MQEFILQINNLFQSLGLQGLAINAMIESCLPGFPLPPDVLLIAMDLAKPEKALFYAFSEFSGASYRRLPSYLQKGEKCSIL